MQIYTCSKKAIEVIRKDGVVLIQGFGGSMEPLLHSGDIFRFVFVQKDTKLEKGDIVFCKVENILCLHKITAIKGEEYQIGNNKGKINGWTVREHIYGKFTNIVLKNSIL